MNRFTQHILLGLAVLVGSIGVIAGPPPLTITDSGYYLTIVDTGGVPSLVRIQTVVDLRTPGETPPADDPSDEPTPPAKPPVGISADVASWASELDLSAETQKYALVLETVRDGIVDDVVTLDTVFDVLNQSADLILSDSWEPVRRKIGDHFVDLAQRGKLGSTTQLANQIELIRYGLAYSAADQESISPGEALAVVSKVNSIIAKVGK